MKKLLLVFLSYALLVGCSNTQTVLDSPLDEDVIDKSDFEIIEQVNDDDYLNIEENKEVVVDKETEISNETSQEEPSTAQSSSVGNKIGNKVGDKTEKESEIVEDKAETQTITESQPETTSAIEIPTPVPSEQPKEEVIQEVKEEIVYSGWHQSDYASSVFNKINSVRISNGLSELPWNDGDTWLADTRVEELVDEVASNTVHSGLKKYDRYVGEIAGFGYSPSGVVDAWMSSSGHANQILADYNTSMAVGVYYDEYTASSYYIVIFR